MSVNLFTYTALILSPLLCMITNTWISMWILLEISTLSYASALKFSMKMPKNKDTESSLKYFIIQSIASSLLMMSAAMTLNLSKLCLLLLVSSLMIKMAAAPFHDWFLKLMHNSKWNNMIILSTWQKLAPVFLVSFLKIKLLLPFILLSASIGALSQMNKKTTSEIMALSSIFNLSWILVSSSLSITLLFMFLSLYWVSTVVVMMILKNLNLKTLDNVIKSKLPLLTTMLMFANLAGIPPLAGFVSKWLATREMLISKLMTLTTFMLVISGVNFFIYLRILTPSLITPLQIQSTNPKGLMKNKTWFSMFLILPVFLLVF